MNPILWVVLPVVIVCMTSFLSVAVWASARRQEREAFYRHEAIKHIANAQGPSAEAALELLREQEKIANRRRRSELRLAAPVLIATGLGLFLFLQAVDHRQHSGVLGLIPILIGIALLLHTYVVKEKPE